MDALDTRVLRLVERHGNIDAIDGRPRFVLGVRASIRCWGSRTATRAWLVVEATDRLGETDRPGRNLMTSGGAGQQDCWTLKTTQT
jgi:hypothetical protein